MCTEGKQVKTHSRPSTHLHLRVPQAFPAWKQPPAGVLERDVQRPRLQVAVHDQAWSLWVPIRFGHGGGRRD